MKLLVTGTIGLIVVSIVVFTYRDYVGPQYRYRWGYAEEATAVSAYTAKLRQENEYELYVTNEYYVTDVMRFMTYQPGDDPFTQPYPYHRLEMSQALAGEFPTDRPVAVIFGNWAEENEVREALMERYPGSETRPIPRIDTPWKREGPAGYVVFIPQEALSSDVQLKYGYLTRFYEKPNWEGEPYATYVDQFFAFPENIEFVPFSARWDGILRIDEAGEYRFYMMTSNRAQLIIDDVPLMVLDNYSIENANARQEQNATISLTTGTHKISILFNFEAGDRQIRLLWATPQVGDLKYMPAELLTPITP
jgi:hypothetical protein